MILLLCPGLLMSLWRKIWARRESKCCSWKPVMRIVVIFITTLSIWFTTMRPKPQENFISQPDDKRPVDFYWITSLRNQLETWPGIVMTSSFVAVFTTLKSCFSWGEIFTIQFFIKAERDVFTTSKDLL